MGEKIRAQVSIDHKEFRRHTHVVEIDVADIKRAVLEVYRREQQAEWERFKAGCGRTSPKPDTVPAEPKCRLVAISHMLNNPTEEELSAWEHGRLYSEANHSKVLKDVREWVKAEERFRRAARSDHPKPSGWWGDLMSRREAAFAKVKAHLGPDGDVAEEGGGGR